MASLRSLSSMILSIIFTIVILTINCESVIDRRNEANNKNIGHFMVIINSHLSFILCSTSKAELDKGQLKLININDVLQNDHCIQSSQFNLQQNQLLFEQKAQKLIKINKSKTKSLGMDLFTFSVLQQKLPIVFQHKLKNVQKRKAGQGNKSSSHWSQYLQTLTTLNSKTRL